MNTEKYEQLVDKIKKSNVSDEQKMFLIQSACRHNVFNYSKIAEYYAHQDREMQELMEQSALVIIDFDDAIKNGFVELKEKMSKIEEKDEEYDDD